MELVRWACLMMMMMMIVVVVVLMMMHGVAIETVAGLLEAERARSVLMMHVHAACPALYAGPC